VAVAAGLFAGVGGPAEVGNDGFKIADEQRNAFCFRSQGEELLFEIQIEGQGTGQVEREQRRVGSGEILFGARDGEEIGMQLNRAQGVCLRWCSRVVMDHEDLSLKKGAFLVDAHDLETLAAFGYEVEAAVRILFDDGNDLGGASHFGETLFDSAHYAETTMLSQAFANHFFVARFEYVQGQGNAGEQDDIERKQG